MQGRLMLKRRNSLQWGAFGELTIALQGHVA
jgi:hypothetical protein